MTIPELRKKITKSIFVKNDKVYTRNDCIAEIFDKNIQIVDREIEAIVERYKSDKDEYKFLKNVFPSEKFWYLDLNFFGILTNSYVSKRATTLKYFYVDEMIEAQWRTSEKRHLSNIGCNEVPGSVLGPILKDIIDKVNLIVEKTDEIGLFMEKNKKKDLSVTEKLHKKMKEEQILEKIQSNVRKKTIEIMNIELANKKSHGLVYDMKDELIKERKAADEAAAKAAAKADLT